MATGHSAPACSGVGTDHVGGLHPSATQGNVSNPLAGEGTSLPHRRGPSPQQVWKASGLTSMARQWGPAAALPGHDSPEDVCGPANIAFREGAAGRSLLWAE